MAYRGYSYSDKVRPNEAGLQKDVDAIADFLIDPAKHDKEIAEHINKELIFGHGRSLGGAVAIYMVEKFQPLFRGMIIENTFTSIYAVSELFFPIFKLRLFKPLKPFLVERVWNND